MASLADAVYLVGAGGRGALRQPGRRRAARLRRRGELLGRASHATIHSRRPDGAPFPEDECPLLRPRVTRRDGARRARLVRAPRRQPSCRSATRRRRWTTPDGRGAVVVFRDVTERLAADEVAASRARIVAATDAERRRIGRDLHDGAQQRLVRALMGIEEARRDPERAEDGARAAPPPTRAARSTTCASSPPACTRSSSPTAASPWRSRS